MYSKPSSETADVVEIDVLGIGRFRRQADQARRRYDEARVVLDDPDPSDAVPEPVGILDTSALGERPELSPQQTLPLALAREDAELVVVVEDGVRVVVARRVEI